MKAFAGVGGKLAGTYSVNRKLIGITAFIFIRFGIIVSVMSVFRVILSILFPPLAVYDRGCGSILIVFILTCIGWVPGVIAALVILNKK